VRFMFFSLAYVYEDPIIAGCSNADIVVAV
jgi:hypothetical protein